MNLNYKYGLLDPATNVEMIEEQLVSTHHYQNKLVELERVRRKGVDGLINTPELVAAYAHALEGKAQKVPDAEQKRRWKVVSTIRKANKIKFAAQIAVFDAEHKEARRAERGDTSAYWGSYLQAERAASSAASDALKESGKAPPDKPVYPHFRRWKKNGNITVQIQKGMSVERLLSGQDTRLKLDLTPMPIAGRSGKPRPTLFLRIGTEEGGRDPIWAGWPIIDHRPLPPDAVIKDAKVLRIVRAARPHWHVSFTLEFKRPEPAAAAASMWWVALDIGWRRTQEDPKSATRAGEWFDGKTGKELVLADDIIRGLVKADDLRSIRAKHRLEIQSKLLDFKKDKKSMLPEAFADRVRFLAHWEAEAQFAGLCWWWHDNRFTGDENVYPVLEKWRKKDKHLWAWEVNQRRRSLARRDDYYHCVAAELVGIYDGLIIENLNLTKLTQKNKEQKDDQGQHQSRAQKQNTAPSHLRSAVVNAFKREGKPVFNAEASPNARALYQAWSEGKGKVMVQAPARSKRFKRLRKIVEPVSEKIAV